MASSAGDPWAYTPPLSLWHLVEQNVSLEEQDEIKSMLGTSLVETTLDLHNEVKMLLEIWQDYKESETENSNARPLAEPPHVRDRLIQEICFLAESVREKSASKGMNPSVLLSRHNSQVLEYAEETKRCGSSCGLERPQSARGSDGRQTPLISSDHANSHFALDSTITEEVSSANDKLNYLQFDEVCNRLRETLTKEMEQLETDAAFLHSCLTGTLDDTGLGSTPALSREPTLTDLKEERSQLEKDLLSAESLPNTPPVHKPPFLPASSASGISTMPTLGPVNARLRPAHNSSTASSTRNVPLKASHHVSQTLTLNSAISASSGPAHPASDDSSLNASSVSKTSASVRVGTQNISMQSRLTPDQSASKPDKGSYHETQGKDGHAGKREGSALHGRIHSAARVKVVPVGSVLEPRVDSAGSRSLMPTPPPGEEVRPASRPSSAQRFRKLVMSYRETT